MFLYNGCTFLLFSDIFIFPSGYLICLLIILIYRVFFKL